MTSGTRLALALVAVLGAGAAFVWYFARPHRPGVVLDPFTRCHTEGAHRELDRDFARVTRIEREIHALLAARGEKR